MWRPNEMEQYVLYQFRNFNCWSHAWTQIHKKAWTSEKIALHPLTNITGSWWRHQMETFSALLALCAGNSPVTGEFPSQRPVTRSFDVFFDQRRNKRLSKQSWGWWFETQSRSLRRHCNVKGILCGQRLRRPSHPPGSHLMTLHNAFIVLLATGNVKLN